MSMTLEDILNALRTVQEPELNKDLVTLNMIRDVHFDGTGDVEFTVMLTTPACPLRGQIQEEARRAVARIPGVKNVNVKLNAEVNKDLRLFENKALSAGVRNIIAVASGKGGVGKSTTAVNLAVALRQSGARVGLLDADIYGPNVPMMMGLSETERPAVNDQQHMIPFEHHGVKVMSIGFLVEPGKAIIWRGPMLHGVIRHFLGSVEWGDLDYLVVDLPPGTGDAPLSLVQSVPLSGAVVVTTPQAVAQSDVRRSIAMFNEVRVPILGIIENMAGLDCPHCHQHIDLFQGSGGTKLSKEYEVPLLGQIPFDPAIGEAGDKGAPIVISQPQSAQAKAFLKTAEWVAARISVLQAGAESPLIQIG
jgi:ATP-binding protein involved in chromosome partitioning